MPYVTSESGLLAAVLLCTASLWTSTAWSQGRGTRADSLTEPGAVAEAMRSSPTLRASLLDWYEAQQQVLAEEGRYVPTWSVDAGVTHSESPRLSNDSTATSSYDSVDVGTELRHTFPWGTGVSVRLEGSRASSGSPAYTGEDRIVTLGPGYGIVGRLAVTQPLLRGFGTDVGEASLRQAMLGRDSAEQSRDRLASETLRDVLGGYWELWQAERALDIDRSAAALAAQQRDEALQRLAAGAIASADTLSFETRLAELEQSVLASEVAWQQASLRLGLLLGREATPDKLHAAATNVPAVAAPSREALLEAAVKESPAVIQAQSQLALAEHQASTAGESDRPRLDLEAYLQTQGLGNEEVVPALEQFATFGAVSAHVGAVFELPLSGGRHTAQRRAAAAAVEAARARLSAAEQQARSDAAVELIKLDQAQRRVTLSEATAAIAERNVDAQRKRYEKGDAILLEVRQAEDELRRARLAVQRARVDVVLAAVRIDHVSGRLLLRYAGIVPHEVPATRASADATP